MKNTLDVVTADTTFGFLNKHAQASQAFHPVLVSNDGENTMLRAILQELRRSQSFVFSTAFVTSGAIAQLKQALLDFGGTGTIVTSTYQNFNGPDVFKELLNLPGIDVYVYTDPDDRRDGSGGFHAKGYLFDQGASKTAIIGSSNLTQKALSKNKEWNLRFSAMPDGDIVEQLERAVDDQIARSVPLTSEWITAYEARYVAPTFTTPTIAVPGIVRSGIQPNAMQREALAEIAKLRDAGERRAVVVSATGTGKTILSALDVRAATPDRMLFVVHREQILDRAIEEFKRVLGAPEEEFGKFVGQSRQLDRKYIFATIQSIARPENLALIDPQHFEYVLIDEVHRAGAPSYRRLVDHLTPEFLLGVTATPERTDEFNVFELFDYNVPYEIRLQKALEEDMLAPFHYYGVTDFEQNGEVIDEAAQLSKLASSERADHVVRAIERYGHVGAQTRGLMFCSRTAEAQQLSELLNKRSVHGHQLRTRVLTGDDSIDRRERVVEELEAGSIDYILTVDVFNEGIDIPSVNQVVMLRQTQSSIVFTQQLGRGLRKAAGKDHLIVIDFIGNYANNYLIPIALFGDSSLNKDAIRKKLLDAQDAGVISGLSSVNFDQISRERIFASLAATKLDSMANLKREIRALEQRLGRAPHLYDFARFDTVDPVVVATKEPNYWALLRKVKLIDDVAPPQDDRWLTFLCNELLNGKRPHELLLLQALLQVPDGGLPVSAFAQLLRENRCAADPETIASVARIFSFEFFVEIEQKKYGTPVAHIENGSFVLERAFADSYRRDTHFAARVDDVLETGLFLARHRYQWGTALAVGQRYSRKDVCRLLNWRKNQQGVVNGYKVDAETATCPIFITHDKHEDVAASTAYEDELVNEANLRWFTRSKRTLQSAELQPILSNRVDLHLFAKKDDAEGLDFFYLGQARSSNAEQTKMPGNKGEMLNVVTMNLALTTPLELGLYDYLAGGGR